MFSKIFLIFIVVVRFASIRSEDNFSSIPDLQTVRNEMFEKISLWTKLAWNETARENQNFHLVPFLTKLPHYMALMRTYYYRKTELSRDTFLARPYAFASILDTLQNSSNVHFKISTILFYDTKNPPLEEFAEDMKTHFHTDTRAIPLRLRNVPSILAQINEWRSTVTNGKVPKIKQLDLNGRSSLDYTIFRFKGFWDTAKSPSRTRRSIPVMVPKVRSSYFEFLNDYQKVNVFDVKARIGYYNDVEQGYVAISLPFKNGEFAMAILLPHYGRSMKIFTKFSGSDYQKVIQRVDENRAYVHCTIPIINSTALSIHYMGAGIGSENFGDYMVVREEPWVRNKITYMPFLVDRPFGVMIYHVETSFVLLYASVRNPFEHLWPLPHFRISLDSDGEEESTTFLRFVQLY